MASIGTSKRPAIIRVQTEDRATEVMDFCNDRGIVFILGLEPDKPEDISDIDRALQARQPALATPKIGRNEPCPCASGKKFKKCCEGRQPQTAS